VTIEEVAVDEGGTVVEVEVSVSKLVLVFLLLVVFGVDFWARFEAVPEVEAEVGQGLTE